MWDAHRLPARGIDRMDVPWQFVHTVMILEGCISKVKAELKRVKANTARKLRNALRRAYAKVTLADIRGWFRHCGYSVP
jgi:hypothetical protein